MSVSDHIGLSTKVVQDRPMREAAEIAAKAGYRGLEIFGVPNHLPPETTDAELRAFRKLFDDLGLRTVTIASYAGGFAELGDRDCEAELDVFRRYLEMAAALGCDMVRLWPDKLGRNIAEPRDDHLLRAAHYLARAADLAAESQVKVLLENHLTLTISLERTTRLIELIDRPNVVINFDPGNMYLASKEYGRPTVLRLLSRIGNVQVKECSMRTTQGGADPSLRGGGTYDLLLGEGDMDHLDYLRPLAEAGYDGFYMAECHKHPTSDWPSDRIAQHEYTALKELLERASR